MGEVDRGAWGREEEEEEVHGGGGDGGGFTNYVKFNCKHKNVSKTFSKPPIFTQQ